MKNDVIRFWRLVPFRGCRACHRYVPPDRGMPAFCHLYHEDLDPEPEPDKIREGCVLPGPGDPDWRYNHIDGCMDCPHCQYLESEPENDSLCQLTGRVFPSPWYYDEEWDTEELDDYWVHSECPLPATQEPPRPMISWEDY